MTLLKLLFAVVFLGVAHSAAADESFQNALQRGAAAHPSQYSFADLYRVTVAGPGAAAFPAAAASDAPIRVATGPAPAHFSVAEVPEPRLWLLLLSGLALAVWVARRRLGYAL